MCLVALDGMQYVIMQLSIEPNLQFIFWVQGQTRMATVATLAPAEGLPTRSEHHQSPSSSSKSLVHVVNTHYDERGLEARAHSSTLILKQLREAINSDDLVILLGDLNRCVHLTS